MIKCSTQMQELLPTSYLKSETSVSLAVANGVSLVWQNAPSAHFMAAQPFERSNVGMTYETVADRRELNTSLRDEIYCKEKFWLHLCNFL